jgi:hypothetical protein
MYESRLQDSGKNEYPWLTSDFVDEMEERTIRTKGANVNKAKTARMTVDARANILSSLERIEFMTRRLRTKHLPD